MLDSTTAVLVLNLVLQFSHNAKFSTAVYDSCWSGAGSLKFSTGTSSGTSVYIAVRTAVIDTAVLQL